jgi:hypothetical protein
MGLFSDMNARTALRIGLVLWSAAFILSFVDFRLTEASGDGFLSGMNKLGKFAIWQGVAAVIAAGVWVIGLRFEKRTSQRGVSRIPGIIAIALVAAVGLFILSANLLGGRTVTSSPPEIPTKDQSQ